MNLSAGNTKTLSGVLLGALLALLTAFGAAAPAFAWSDNNPLTTGNTVRKVYIDELRAAIATKNASFGFAAPIWSFDPTITAGVTLIRSWHVVQMEGYLNQITTTFNPWCPAIVPASPGWNVPSAGTPIRVSDFQQLRNYVDALGTGGACCSTCRYAAGASGCQPLGAGAEGNEGGGGACPVCTDCNGGGGCAVVPDWYGDVGCPGTCDCPNGDGSDLSRCYYCVGGGCQIYDQSCSGWSYGSYCWGGSCTF